MPCLQQFYGKSNMYGKDYPYAQTRLADTVVRLEKDGIPIYILSIHPVNGEVQYQLLSGVDSNEISVCHLDDINTCPVPLGYTNTSNYGALYLERMPVRRYRQGLRRDNMICKDGIRVDVISWANIDKTIRGDYPTLKEAYKSTASTGRSMAWARNWAVDGAGILYKSNKVGLFKAGLVPVLEKNFTYLKEALEEEL